MGPVVSYWLDGDYGIGWIPHYQSSTTAMALRAFHFDIWVHRQRSKPSTLDSGLNCSCSAMDHAVLNGDKWHTCMIQMMVKISALRGLTLTHTPVIFTSDSSRKSVQSSAPKFLRLTAYLANRPTSQQHTLWWVNCDMQTASSLCSGQDQNSQSWGLQR